MPAKALEVRHTIKLIGELICLAPGFLNDHNAEFAWLLYDYEEVLPCALFTHKSDNRDFVLEFVRTVQEIYKGKPGSDL